jgi:hypothetical protein
MCRWQNTIEMDIKETGRYITGWIYLTEVKVRSRAVVNMAMKFDHLGDCQRVKKVSAPLMEFVSRHIILDLFNQRRLQALRIIGLYKTHFVPIPVGLLGSWVRIPPGAWMSVSCECCVLSGRGLCDELITRPEES